MAALVEPPDAPFEWRAFLREAGPEGIVGIALMVAILATMGLGVFYRYVLNDSLSWSEELSRYGLVYATFIGAALACRRGSHIRVSVLDDLLPTPWARRLRVLQDLITLVFLVYVTILAVQITSILHGTKSAAMLLPMSFVYAAIVAGFGLASARLAIRLLSRQPD